MSQDLASQLWRARLCGTLVDTTTVDPPVDEARADFGALGQVTTRFVAAEN